VTSRALALVVVVLTAAPAAAQNTPGPPGPYVLDVRGTTVALPEGAAFLPPVSITALVPSRAFGVDAGGHLYIANWRQARVGVGASVLVARGTALDVNITERIVAPQLSLNWGTANGWSYLSTGVGRGHIESRRVTPASSTSTSGQSTGSGAASASTIDNVTVNVLAINFGGGARWFISRRVAVGFDIRLHKIGGGTAKPTAAATPGAMLLAASAGLSFR
jgi:hypothetical protein